MGFYRQDYWSGLPCSPPGDLPDPGIEPVSPALQEDSLSTELSRSHLLPKGCSNSEGRDVPSMFVLFFSVRTPSRDAAEMSREVVGDPGSDSTSTAISPGYWVLEVIRSSQGWLTRQREREYSAYSCKRNSLLKLSWNIPSVFSLARVWRDDSQAVHLSTAGVYRAQLRVFVPLFTRQGSFILL